MRFAGNRRSLLRTLLAVALAAWAQMAPARQIFAQTPARIAPLPRQCRIVLLPAPETIYDARLLEALTQMRIGKRGRTASPRPPRRPNDRFTKLQQRAPKTKTPALPPLTASQLRTVARVLFRETLADRLQTALKASLVPDEMAAGALQGLSLDDLTPVSAAKVAAQCRADAVLTIEGAALTLPAKGGKQTVLRVRLRCFGPRLLPAPDANTGLPERDFVAASAAERPVTPFGKRPSRIGGQGTGRAARQAALRAAHTLRTGEILPLCLPGVKFALAPVPAPTAADALVFAAGGRNFQKGATRGLSAEMSGFFTPDLAPLPAAALLPPYKLRQLLARQGLPITALWTKEDEPQSERARSAARKLGADYILMAAVSDLEVDAGLEAQAKTTAESPDGTRPMIWLAEARAEAVGVLLRVSDGAILWRDRAAVTLPTRADRARSFSTLRQEQTAARDAAKFALLDLQRRFHRYIAHFEN